MSNLRVEASNVISEFNLTEVGKEIPKLSNLSKLKKNSSHIAIKNQLKNAVSKKNVLDVALSKPQAAKIKRTVAYGKVCEEVGKWDSIVRANRVSEQIIFPLKKPDFRLETAEQFSKRFQSKNALEEEVSKILSGSDNVLEQEKVLSAAEEKALKAMDLAEARARLTELKKMRVLLSHQEARARRQKKIKSKRYHRLLKKEKMKKLLKEFEELQKSDPVAADEKLQEADKLRILERMTLKHRSTGKWAKQHKIRAQYNVESRVALKEQITLGRSLTEKVLPFTKPTSVTPIEADDENSDDGEDGDLLSMYHSTSDIPPEKLKPLKSIQRIPTYVAKDVPKFVEPVGDEPESDDQDQEAMNETTKRLMTLEDCESVASKSIDGPSLTTEVFDLRTKSKDTREVSEKKTPVCVSYVAETDFSTEMTFLDSLVPDDITLGEEGVDDVDEDRMNIMQAFADEDLISEFKEQKRSIVESEQVEEINLSLPGWGSWGGKDIKENNRKRKRFYTKPVDTLPRKDDTLGNVIISEDKDKKAAVHQVSELPFPFKTVEQFHSVIRQPVGRTWNPETNFQKMIAPKIVTKIGKIIDPIDMEDVVMEKTEIDEKKLLQDQKHEKDRERKKKFGKQRKSKKS